MTSVLLRAAVGISAAALACAASSQVSRAPDVAALTRAPIDRLFAENRYSIRMSEGRLAGPGADLLREAAALSQYFVIGEQHNAAEIPQFTTALFRSLVAEHGYGYLALEQDPFAVADASRPGARGNVLTISNYAKRYPAAFTFKTDEELTMIAEAGEISP